MSAGSEALLQKYGSVPELAEAWVSGKLSNEECGVVGEIVDFNAIKAAAARLRIALIPMSSANFRAIRQKQQEMRVSKAEK